MEKRRLGSTGLDVSVLTFGCGAVGGLMVKGSPADQARAFAHAVEQGVNIFDTAPGYGDGVSETNLGRILKTNRTPVIIGTKVRLKAEEKGSIAAAVARSLDQSLARLGRDYVDLFQLHNRITLAGSGPDLTPELVLQEVAPAFKRLVVAGKTRFFGITSLGETAALHRVTDAGTLHTGQVVYNPLIPSAAEPVAAGYPGQDYGRLLERMAAARMGSIGIRVLAGGAMSGSEVRNPIGSPNVEPLGSDDTYARDAARARSFEPLVREGHAGSLVELAIRYAVSCRLLSTFEVGIASYEQFAGAVTAVKKGPLSAAALARVKEIQATFRSPRPVA